MFIPKTPWQLRKARCRSWRLRPRASAHHLQSRTSMPLRLAKALCVFTLLPVRCSDNAWEATWKTYHEAPRGHFWLARRRPKGH